MAVGQTEPEPSETQAAEYVLSAFNRGELTLQQCTQCGEHWWPAKRRCPVCLGALRFVPAEGRGSIYSHVTVHQVEDPIYARLVPYEIAQVDLVEQVRVTARVIGIEPTRSGVGESVHVEFAEADLSGTTVCVPYFKLSSSPGNE
jgi:uncharacterized protein